ncbi:MAG: uroporphyrinogen III synthase [Burkholderiales bacterium 68-12]|nr:MAG: uroporphyrinogen III synthase [Burkholderiales bacterium 68-12]
MARIIVTRPEREALQWAEQLRAHGIDACALPLIAIGPPADPGALAQARARVQHGAYGAVMVVSSNAAQHFFDEKTALAFSQQAQGAIHSRVWSPGPGTARALRALGVDGARIDTPAADATQFDSEALWPQVAAQVVPGTRVLIVRGTEAGAAEEGTGRDWLARQIRAAGGQVDFTVAYTRSAPQWDAAQRRQAQEAAGDGALWLLSSSQAVDHLRAALPGQDWHGARALATHPRIAQAARAAGFGSVYECRPALRDVLASIESLP